MTAPPRLRILAISQDFSNRNPGGAALLRVLAPLADRHELTCLGGGSPPPGFPSAATYVRVPRLHGCGLLANFLWFHLAHRVAWLVLTRLRGRRYDVVQTIDAESLLGTVVTFQFCDAAYLPIARQAGLFRGWNLASRLTGLQEHALRLLRRAIQRRVCAAPRTRAIIAVSARLADDLRAHCQPRVDPVVIPNAAP